MCHEKTAICRFSDTIYQSIHTVFLTVKFLFSFVFVVFVIIIIRSNGAILYDILKLICNVHKLMVHKMRIRRIIMIVA